MKRAVCILVAVAGVVFGQDKPIVFGQTEPVVKNVELTVYLVSGAQAPAADDVPQDLATTVRQLHSLFPYKGYKLAESFILRGRNNQGTTNEGVLSGSGLHYRFFCSNLRLSPEKPYMLHIDNLSFTISGPASYGTDGKQRNTTIAAISTNLDLGDGQKTVVGKSSINSTEAMILVIVPKVIE